MKRIVFATIAFLIAFSFPFVTLASDISHAVYHGTVTVTNNGTATTNVVTPFSTNITAMIAQGWVSSNLTNTAIRSGTSDIPHMPGLNSDKWWVFAESIAASSSLSYDIYTGGASDMVSALVYFPAASGMTVADNNTSLEPGSNFTIQQIGRWNTDNGTSKYSVYKSGAIAVGVNPTISGNITANITGTSGLTQTLAPNGVGDITTISTLVGAATHWQAVLTNDADTSYVLSAGAVTEYDTYAMENGTIPSYALIDSVVVHAVTKRIGVLSTHYVAVIVRLAGVNVFGADQATTVAYVDYSESLAKPGGGNWIAADIPNLQAGVQHKLAAADAMYTTQVYVVVNYHYPDTVTSLGSIASGEHTITAKADSTFLGLGVDATNATYPISTGLAYNAPLWSENTTGSTNFTSLDTNRILTTINGPTWTSQGRTFDGINDKIFISSPTFLSNSQGTFSFWMKAFANDAQYIPVCTATNNATTDEFLVGYNLNGNKEIDVVLIISGATFWSAVSPNNTIIDTDFHMITLSSDGAVVTLKVDNVAKVLTDTSGINSGQWFASAPLANTFCIGEIPRSPAVFSLKGTIGEVQIYNVALSASQITQNYLATRSKYDGTAEKFNYTLLNNGVTPNASNWVFCQNGIMDFMTLTNITIGGNPCGYWAWQYSDKFYDQWGGGNTATPSFPISSSDADVLASLANLSVINPAQIGSFTISTPGSILSGNLTAPSQLYTSGNFTYIPGAESINAVLDTSGTPRALWWYPFLFGFIAILGLLLYGPTSGGNRTVLIQCALTEILFIFLGIMNPLPLLCAYLFPISALAIISSQKHQTLG